MKMHLSINIYIGIEMLLAMGILFATVFGMGDAVSLFFHVSFVVLVVAYLTFSSMKGVSVMLLLIVFCTALCVTLNCFISEEAYLSFSYIKKMLIFFSTLIYFCIAIDMRPSKNLLKMVKLVPVLSGGLLILNYLFGNVQKIGNAVSFGFHNPNFTAMWLLHLLLYAFIYIIQSKNIFAKLFYVVLAVWMAYFIVLTKCRSMVAAFLVFLIMYLLGLKKKNYRFKKGILFGFTILPIATVLIYLLVIDKTFINVLFRGIVSEGKGLDSRVIVWTEALSHFASNWLIGDYSGISDGLGVSQMHNTHLDVLASYGIVVFILFVKYMYDILKKANKRVTNRRNYIALCAFISILVGGCFEAAIFSGNTGLSFLTGGYLLMLNQGEETE